MKKFLLSIAFTTVGISHFGATHISNYLIENFETYYKTFVQNVKGTKAHHKNMQLMN